MIAHELDRFLQAQESVYARALRELSAGREVSHWMWFMSRRYAIRSIEEPRELFELVAGAASVFASALEKYFAGERDARTIELLRRPSEDCR